MSASDDVQLETQTAINVAGIQANAQTTAAQTFADANLQSATVQANAQIHGYDQQFAASEFSSTESFNAAIQTAELSAQAQEFASGQAAVSRVASSQLELTGVQFSSSNQLIGSKYTADQNLQATRYTADQHFTGTKYTADQSLAAATLQANTDLSARQYVANANLQGVQFSSGNDLTGRKYAADQGLASATYTANQQFAGVGLHEASENARLNTKLNFNQARFLTVWPYAQQAITASLITLATNNGFVGPNPPPFISTNGYASPSDIQAQVNAAYALNDARTQTAIRQAQGELAGRGFSANSPILDAVSASLLSSNLRANSEVGRQIKFDLLKLNGDASRKGQELLNTQFSQQETALIEAERNAVQRQVGIIQGLGSLIGGLS